jgi:hypothetical protein
MILRDSGANGIVMISISAILTREFLQTQSPGTPITREMEEFEAPFSNAKIKQLLGFVEKHPWRKYFNNWEKKVAM